MLQNLDVISVNFWQILISLVNLLILFFILKKFLFKPVTAIFEKRKQELELQYTEAEKAAKEAEANRLKWEETLSGAKSEADAILESATTTARLRSDKILAEATERADGIISEAKTEAELTHKKAREGIRREIVAVSGALTEKLLEREINGDDHREMIDRFLDEMGEAP